MLQAADSNQAIEKKPLKNKRKKPTHIPAQNIHQKYGDLMRPTFGLIVQNSFCSIFAVIIKK